MPPTGCCCLPSKSPCSVCEACEASGCTRMAILRAKTCSSCRELVAGKTESRKSSLDGPDMYLLKNGKNASQIYDKQSDASSVTEWQASSTQQCSCRSCREHILSRVTHSRRPQKEMTEASTYKDPCRVATAAIYNCTYYYSISTERLRLA